MTKSKKLPAKRAKSAGLKPESDNSDPVLSSYDSMDQCSASLGIPKQILRHASKSGCKAFRHGRIYTRPLIHWICSDQAGGNDWAAILKEFQAKREKLKHDNEAGRLVDFDAARDAVAVCLNRLFGTAERIFCQELPPVLKGLDEMSIRKRSLAEVERLRVDLRAEFGALAKDANE